MPAKSHKPSAARVTAAQIAGIIVMGLCSCIMVCGVLKFGLPDPTQPLTESNGSLCYVFCSLGTLAGLALVINNKPKTANQDA